MADWIIECLPIKSGTILDLFCGGCSVSYALKSKGFTVIANDALYSNFAIAKAIIENSCELLSLSDFDSVKVPQSKVQETLERIQELSNKVYFDFEVEELAYLVNVSEKIPSYKKFLFLALLRRAMIRKIPYSRMNVKWEEIQKFRDEEYSYRKYGRYRHYHNIPFIEHIKSNMVKYNQAVIPGDNCVATHYDALDCIRKMDKKVDVIYMDPPYPSTMNNYQSFYWGFDLLFNEKNLIKLDLTNKTTFLMNFSNLIKTCIGKTHYVVISMNNKCYPSVEVLLGTIKNHVIEYKIKTKEHVYKVTGKENKHTNYEILLICKLKEN